VPPDLYRFDNIKFKLYYYKLQVETTEIEHNLMQQYKLIIKIESKWHFGNNTLPSNGADTGESLIDIPCFIFPSTDS
jgi:hypothetical protein